MPLTLRTPRALTHTSLSTGNVARHGLYVSRHQRRGPAICTFALPDKPTSVSVDIRKLSDVITSQALESDERRHTLESIASELGETIAVVKNMGFRQKGLLSLEPAEIKAKVQKVADVVGVSYEKARQMCVIQPSLLTETESQAEALQYGLRIICHDLRAEKDEIVDLLIANPSLLYGRQMRLSAADMAHLALLREPKGRIVD